MAEELIQANGSLILQECILKYGDGDTWLGRVEPPLTDTIALVGMQPLNSTTDIMEIIAGRFFLLQHITEYMQCMISLFQKVQAVAQLNQILTMWEDALGLSVEMKRLTHHSMPDCADQESRTIVKGSSRR